MVIKINQEFQKISDGKFSSALILSDSGKYEDALIILNEAIKIKIQSIFLIAGLPEVSEEKTIPAFKQYFLKNDFFRKDFTLVFERIENTIKCSNILGRDVSKKEFLEIMEDIKTFFEDADIFIKYHIQEKREDVKLKTKKRKMEYHLTKQLILLSDEKLDSAVNNPYQDQK